MNVKGVTAVAILACLLVSGGWFLQRGLITTTNRAAASPINGRALYEEVLARVQAKYVDSIPADALFAKTVDGVLRELHDPHSVYLPPERLARLNEGAKGRGVGIGVQVDVLDDWITVVSALPGGPAHALGIQSGDRLTKIDGQSTYRWTPDEALQMLQGEPGTTVRVTVTRRGAGPMLLTVSRRANAVLPQQHAMVLTDGIGYVDLAEFNDQAAADLRRAIDSLQVAGAHSLVLDLREDSGGLLAQGVAVADLFLNAGDTIVNLRGQGADVNRAFSDGSQQPWPGLKIAVLVDSGSASASEVVAGALQDHDRAIVVGTRTFGKGSAQTVFSVTGGGGVRLTVARWFTPLGRSIDRSGDAVVVAGATSPAKPPTFKTKSGRVVEGGGGINPDVIVPDSMRFASHISLDPRTTSERLAILRADPVVQRAIALLRGAATQADVFARTKAKE